MYRRKELRTKVLDNNESLEFKQDINFEMKDDVKVVSLKLMDYNVISDCEYGQIKVDLNDPIKTGNARD